MSKQFDIHELLRVAVLDERSGIALYRGLAGKAERAEVRELFSWLSEQERLHEQRFQEMSDSLGPAASTAQYPDEYVDYLSALVAEGGSSDAHRKIGEVTTDMEALDLALRFERDQLSLQRDMSEAIGSDEHRSIVEAIIEEERSHLTRLSAAKRDIR